MLAMVLLIVTEAAFRLDSLLSMPMLMFAVVEPSNWVEVGGILALKDAVALVADNEASTQIIS